MTIRVLAAVVTHNRVQLLSRCLDALLNQTRPVDQILVINNGSTDNTEQLLQARSILHVNQANLGSAGGWASAIDHFTSHDYDFLWLMDDDGFPDKYALSKLISLTQPHVACISSVVVNESYPERLIFPMPLLDSDGFPIIFSNKRSTRSLPTLLQHSSTYPFAHLFNGALISREAILKTGNVHRSYFVYGDEVDYYYRLRSHGAIITSLEAIHFHPDVTSRSYPPFKIYYHLRNGLILNHLYLNQVLLRNILLICSVLARIYKSGGIALIFSYILGSNSPVFWSSLINGLRSQFKPFSG